MGNITEHDVGQRLMVIHPMRAIVVLHHLADRRLRRRAVAERDLHLEQLARDLGLGFLLELAKLLQLVAHREHGIDAGEAAGARSEEHTSELRSLMRISYAVFCLKKKKKQRMRQ